MPYDEDQIANLESELGGLVSPSTEDVLFHSQDYDAGIVGAIATRMALAGGGAYQPADADLTAIAALATTPYGRALLTLANLAGLYTALGVDTDGTLAANSDAKLASQKAIRTYSAVFNVKSYGAIGNGSTDDSTAVIAAIAACYAAGGGVVYFPPGTYRIDSQLQIPNNATTPRSEQPAIILRGAGMRWSGGFADATPTTTTLDLRSTTGPAKIDTRGSGSLTIEQLDLTQTGSAADTNPFVQTTATTLFIRDCSFRGHTSLDKETCVQDAIVLGGTTTTLDGAADAAFEAYGTVIERNYFTRIRRCLYGRVYCNATVFMNNTISPHCGSDNTGAAIVFDGGVGSGGCRGNVLIGNLIELTGYVYGVRLKNANRTQSLGNSFWDSTGSLVACYLLEGTAADTGSNSIQDIFSGPPAAKWLVDSTTPSGTTYFLRTGGTYMGNVTMSGGDGKTVVQPEASTGNENAVLFKAVRSTVESTFPNVAVFQVLQSGDVYLGAGSLASPSLVVTGTTGSTTYDHVSLVKASGNYDVYPGSGATDKVRIMRGLFRPPIYSTATRPAASAGAGCVYYDTTLSKPAWSDGTVWRDAAGTAV